MRVVKEYLKSLISQGKRRMFTAGHEYLSNIP
jgi:hypothetical protein